MTNINTNKVESPASTAVEFIGILLICLGWLAAIIVSAVMMGLYWQPFAYLALPATIVGFLLYFAGKAIELSEARNVLLEKILSKLESHDNMGIADGDRRDN